MAIIDIKVPDIGDFAEVAIIEVLVKPGDTIKAEQSLITVESDKASMEIPSSHAGVVKELKVKLGDKIAEGSVVLTLEVQGAAAPAPATAPAPAVSEQKQALSPAPQAQAAINSVASSFAGTADMDCDVLVLGGGPGGYSAAFRAADLGLKVVIVERYAALGGVCLNVGCIPSKALLHVAAVMDEVSHFEALGVSYGKPELDLDKLRTHKSSVTGKLTGGLAFMADAQGKITNRPGVCFVTRGPGATNASAGIHIARQDLARALHYHTNTSGSFTTSQIGAAGSGARISRGRSSGGSARSAPAPRPAHCRRSSSASLPSSSVR